MRTLVADPQSLADVYASIRCIAAALGVPERGERLAADMQAAMPEVESQGARPAVLVEWWPKPVIAPARQSWVSDMIALAGGRNPWAGVDAKSVPMENADAVAAMPDVVVMSWCGVKVEKYRADVVRGRPGWERVPAVVHGRVFAVSEAFLGRPGPRLVEGYRALRDIVAGVQADATMH
jgi:iron complex transport system substrate-binding protein